MKITTSQQASQILRTMRTAAEIPRGHLAKRLFISYKTLQKRELGQFTISVETLHATAAEFGMEVHLLPRGTVTTGHLAVNSRRDLGQLIRDLRRRAGLSLGDLAAALGITKSGLGNRETNERAMSVTALTETLDALGYDLIAVPRAAVAERRAA
ncbi:helix-turn-helix domain-containing protein [Actinoplanes palleronii]|uniref:HTH cro/C1-type domain-containing protein n=1 Tax=Actinoplanes palleronii TaxID=113570 RepID=A0ABQ4BJF7_9ACTN|nr:helix-turn-helix transcriptional regulator [Actinoplanes palleronii]GIE70755.1 hypothetical protein Apa02nite_068630 [Actinoplanes palleronii]